MKDRTKKAAYTMRDELRNLIDEISHVDSPFGAEVMADKLKDILDGFDDEVNAIYIDGTRYWETVGGNLISHWTIEPEVSHLGEREYTAFYHGEYGRSSVLAGSSLRGRSQSFETRKEAADYVKQNKWGAEPHFHVAGSTKNPWATTDMPASAPSWFDPADAGEAWGEEDY